MTNSKNYYIGALSWSILQKILSALVNFIATPLLLAYYGKADFGLLALATSCNGYMQLLDLGMNTGAVRYYSIWLAEEKMERIHHVARTNLTFYLAVAMLNMVVLLMLAWFGDGLFSIAPEQFEKLRLCLYTLASFCIFSWLSTAFNQLLVAEKKLAFTMQINCALQVAKALLLLSVFLFDMSVVQYFFIQTALVASLFFPFAWQCLRDNMINRIWPACYWQEFKPVLMFSLSILALSLFQMSATQTRPIILGMFAVDGASSVSDFTIISVFPTLVIMIGSTFTSVFLPKASEMANADCKEEQAAFVYKWTVFTSMIACALCFPLILGAGDILSAYVGTENAYLAKWMIIWVVCTLLQVHSAPANALILGYGKTRVLVYTAAFACIVSMIVNAALAVQLAVGSAIIGYTVYIIINLLVNYCYYYNHVLHLSSLRIVGAFLQPVICGIISLCILVILFGDIECSVFEIERWNYLLAFIVKTLLWFALFGGLILLTRTIQIKDKKVITKFD